MKRYKKVYRDPHAKLKAELATSIAVALALKRRGILQYVANNGTDGLLDFADATLDSGWEEHFKRCADILIQSADISSSEILAETDIDFSEELVSNLARHNDLIAKSEAASLLGLFYDPSYDIAVPTIIGWSIGGSILSQLTRLLEESHAEQWSDSKLEQAIGDMSTFSAARAERMAHDSLAYVDGAAARSTASVTGATMKRSESVNDDKVCPECQQNEMDGWIGINDQFSGSNTEDTPHHPNCRCSVEYQWERQVANI